jgi:hypothetical protein
MKKLLIVVILFSVACAGSPRANLVRTHQSVQIALGAVDDAERMLCFGSITLPVNPTHCTTEAARTAGLTDERHKAIQTLLARAQKEQLRIASVISVWKSGDKINFDTIVSLAKAITDQINQMNASVQIPDLAALIQQIRDWVEEINRLKLAFGAK